MVSNVTVTAFLAGIVIVFSGLWGIRPAFAWIWLGIVLILYAIANVERRETW